jgi:hypothetical protein
MSILKATFKNKVKKLHNNIFSETDRIFEISWSRGFQNVYSRFRPKKKSDPRRNQTQED